MIIILDLTDWNCLATDGGNIWIRRRLQVDPIIKSPPCLLQFWRFYLVKKTLLLPHLVLLKSVGLLQTFLNVAVICNPVGYSVWAWDFLKIIFKNNFFDTKILQKFNLKYSKLQCSAELPIVLSSKSHIIWPKSAQKGAHPFLIQKVP